MKIGKKIVVGNFKNLKRGRQVQVLGRCHGVDASEYEVDIQMYFDGDLFGELEMLWESLMIGIQFDYCFSFQAFVSE